MLNPTHVLAAGAGRPPGLSEHTPLPLAALRRRAVVVGAGGLLGAAVMEQLLATHHFQGVAAWVDQPVQAALRGFVALQRSDEGALRSFAADTALVVFDRARDRHRREVAFVRPLPGELPALAAVLQANGARRLIVVVPHSASLLPMALQQGLASLDEAAVAALGFEQLVFMRMAQGGAADSNPAADVDAPSLPQRLAGWMLSQLHWMVPQREQPVQASTVAKVAAALALQLPQAPPATRVLPAQLLWRAAQQRDAAATVQAWLQGEPLPGLPTQKKLRL